MEQRTESVIGAPTLACRVTPRPFCDIVAGGAAARVVYEGETVLAPSDVSSRTLGHLLVIPKRCVLPLADLDVANGARVFATGKPGAPATPSRAALDAGAERRRAAYVDLLLAPASPTT
jgi:hypothetical protein